MQLKLYSTSSSRKYKVNKNISKTNINNIQHRNAGLDVIRSIAILLVLYGHGLQIIYSHVNPLFADSTLFYSGFFGVELFFVLSGFLIGKIFLKSYFFKESFQGTDIVRFWKRRWLRTLPNYYLILAVYVFLFYFIEQQTFTTKQILGYMFFVQNFFTPNPEFFSQAWSLAIEEWFYLILPLECFFVLFFFKDNKGKGMLFLIAVNILLFNLLRWLHVEDYQAATALLFINPYRLDSILYGVLLAYLYLKQPILLNKYKTVLFVIGLISLLGLFVFYLLNIQVSLDKNSLLFLAAFISPAIATIFPFLINMQYPRFIVKASFFISAISYSLYLIHQLVIHFFIKSVFNIEQSGSAWLGYITFWCSSILIAYLLYHFLEIRFMNWRDKVVKD